MTGDAKRGTLVETVSMYLLMFAYAVFTTILGAILLNLLSEFGMPLTEGGFFNAVLNGGSFVGIVLSGFIIDRYSKRLQTIVIFGLFTLFLFAIGGSDGLWVYVFLLFFAGLATKILDVLLNAGLVDLHPHNKGFYMNLLHACFGTGSFFGPILAGTMLERNHSWRLAYLILAVVAAMLLALYIVVVRNKLRAERTPGAAKPHPAAAGAVVSRRMCLLWFVLFFYCGHQIGINNWLPTYMTETFGLDPLAAGSGVSMFWLGLILGRLSCSFLTKVRPERLLTTTGLALGGVVLLLGVIAGSEFLLFAAVLACGFFSGATIPMVLTIAYGWHPGAQGRVSMILYLAVSIGGVVFPWLMGLMEGAFSLKAAMIANAFMLLVPFVLMLFSPRNKENT